MERNSNSSVFPARFIAVMLAVFIAVMGLPILFAAQAGELALPVNPAYDPAAQSVTFTPAEGWTIASALPQEDGSLVPETTGEGVTVPLAGLPTGETETLQFLCQSQGGEPPAESQVTVQLLPEADGTITLRAYPEKADLLNVDFLYSYTSAA